MYSSYDLDIPPPQSRFRRPWSPEPFDLYSPSQTNHEQDTLHLPHQPHQQQGRREASDISVEALDLANYNMTLNPSGNASRYPPFRGHSPYPPSPLPIRPLASQTSLRTPSLIFGGTTSLGQASSSRSPIRRPFSLPPPAGSHSSFPDDPSSVGHLSNYPYLASPPSIHTTQSPAIANSEIDLSQFPAWSRNWYNSEGQYTSPSPYNDGLSTSTHGISPTNVSPFDPGYSYPNPEPHSHSFRYPMSDESSRDMLPWGGDPPSYGPPIDAEVKEERVRMLQREFGVKNKKLNGNDSEEGEAPVIGSVDSKGNLVTQGPKKRIAVRILEGLLALGSGTTSIYGALIIKPKLVPPPSGKFPAYVLYILSVTTLLAMIYLFIFRSCCSGRQSSQSYLTGSIPGMTVIPIQQAMGGGKWKKGKGGRKAKKGMGGRDVQVNLIVDPGMLQRQQDDRHDEYNQDQDDEESSVPGTYGQSVSQRRTRRRSIFAGLEMENQWRAARGLLKKLMFFDIVCVVLWGTEFMLILIGQRCPSGGFEGWCTAYNVASAGACLLFVAFGVNVFFDIKDLFASKTSPRTRP